MPRFFFNVSDGGQPVNDDCGLDLKDHVAAEHEALRAAAEIAQHQATRRREVEVVVTARDEAGLLTARAVATVRLEQVGQPVEH